MIYKKVVFLLIKSFLYPEGKNKINTFYWLREIFLKFPF